MEEITALASAGLYFSVERDLRRSERLLGLRSARSDPQAQRQERMVARYRRAARRRGRVRLVHHHAPVRVEGFRPRGRVSRRHGGLQGLQARFRLDQLKDRSQCPDCGSKDSFTEPRNFSLMMRTSIGPMEDSASLAYLRPETAQGIFVNFKNVYQTRERSHRSGSRRSANRFATRSRRATLRTGHANSNRPSWNTSCPTTATTSAVSAVGVATQGVVRQLRIRADRLRFYELKPRSARTTRSRDRRRVPVPWGWGELESIAHRAPTISTRT